MFKLLKELAKAPEPLMPPSHSHRSGTPSAGGSGHGSGNEDGGHGPEHLPYTPRSRSGTATSYGRGRGTSASAGPSRSASRRPSVDVAAEKDEGADGEMDENGVKMLQLLAMLRVAEGSGDIMRHVEVSCLGVCERVESIQLRV